MAKIISGKTRQRIVKPDYKLEKIYAWDADNAYPQRVRDLILASGTAKGCWKRYAKYCKGLGFSDEAINKRYLKLLEDCTNDWAMYGTLALHVQYNLIGDVVNLSHVPVEFCRLSTDGTIAVYDNWDKRDLNNPYSAGKIKRYPRYNPNEFKTNLDGFEDINEHPGQIYIHLPNEFEYPLAPCDAVLEDIGTDTEVKTFRKKNIRTNFMASHMLVHKNKFEDENARQEFYDSISDFQGADNVGNIMIIEVEDDTQIPELKPFTIQNNDKLWEYTEGAVISSIIRVFEQTPVLAGVMVAGKLGTSSELEEAHALYNVVTETDRDTIAGIFSMILGVPLSILAKPTLFDQEESEEGENIQQTALNGAQITSLVEVITAFNSGLLTRDAAIEIIINAFPSINREAVERMVPRL
jgi:hypothetical protein